VVGRWSPHIAFTYAPEADASDIGGIAVVNVDDGSFTQLTSDAADGSPAWGSDGRIAFVREGDIYVMMEDGRDVTRLTDDGQSFAPAWSPDAQKIAFVSSRDAECGRWFLDQPPFCTNALYVMDADGSNVQLLRQEEEHLGALDWSFER
jgi:Tol biopolymer transport system component